MPTVVAAIAVCVLTSSLTGCPNKASNLAQALLILLDRLSEANPPTIRVEPVVAAMLAGVAVIVTYRSVSEHILIKLDIRLRWGIWWQPLCMDNEAYFNFIMGV